jgi:hypothetical protein
MRLALVGSDMVRVDMTDLLSCRPDGRAGRRYRGGAPEQGFESGVIEASLRACAE